MRNGALVRSASHAITVPNNSAQSALPTENTREFQTRVSNWARDSNML